MRTAADPVLAASRRGWWVVGAYAGVAAAVQAGWLTYAVGTDGAAQRFGVSVSAVGWLANVVPLLFVAVGIPLGALLDRWFRPSLLAAAGVLVLGAALRLGDSYAWAMAAQVAVGVAQPIVQSAITGVVGRYLPVDDEPAGIAVGSAATFAGMLLGFGLGTALPGRSDLPALVLVIGVLTAVPSVVLAVALRLCPPLRAPVRGPATASIRSGLRAVWADPVLRRVVLLVFAPFGVFVSLSTWTAVLLEPAGVGATAAGLMLAGTVAVGVVLTAVVPVWAARTGRETTVLGAAVTLAVVALLVLAVAPGIVTGSVCLVALGAALLPTLGVVLDVVQHEGGAVLGTATALVWYSGNLGGVVAAGLVGLVTGHPGLVFAVLALATLTCLPLVRGLASALGARTADSA